MNRLPGESFSEFLERTQQNKLSELRGKMVSVGLTDEEYATMEYLEKKLEGNSDGNSNR